MGKSITQLLKNSLRTLGLFWQINPKYFVGFTISIVLVSLLPILNSYYNALLFQEIVKQITQSTQDFKIIAHFFLLASASNLFVQLLWKITDLFEKVTYIEFADKLGVIVNQKISSLDLAKHEDPKYVSLLNKVRDGWGHRPQNYNNRLLWLIYDLLQIIGSFLVVAATSPFYLVFILFSLIPGFINNLKNESKSYGIWDSKAEIKNKYYDTSGYLNQPSFLKEIRIFGLQDKLLGIFSDLFKQFKNEELKVTKSNFYVGMTTRLLEVIVLAFVEFDLISKTIFKSLNVGQYSFVSSSINRFGNALNSAFRNLQSVYGNNLFMTDLFSLLDAKNNIVSPQNAVIINPNLVPKIEFRNVSFKYPKTKKYVFKNLNLTIEPGQDIALVGENGAGKTTFVKLLCRFYDVTSGQILINNTNLKQLELTSWYQNLGILFQDFNHYAYTVFDNIALGDSTKTLTPKLLTKVARESGSYGFIQKFKNKFNQILSKSYDEGTELSGGQWQRLALSRAFFRDANILILDEPTSAIDAKGEYEIFQKIATLQAKKTTIIISHRFSTVRKADLIHVLENGELIESGNHLHLMNLQGKYFHMFSLQAQGYQD